MRWPGRVNANKIDSTSVLSAVDLLPTFAELAQKELPEGYRPDGENFATIFENVLFERKKPLYWDWRFAIQDSARPNRWASGAVRYGGWKLLTDNKQERVELYNITNDRFESKDLSIENKTNTAELLTMLENWQNELPD